jgi:hypothetical protein
VGGNHGLKVGEVTLGVHYRLAGNAAHDTLSHCMVGYFLGGTISITRATRQNRDSCSAYYGLLN